MRHAGNKVMKLAIFTIVDLGFKLFKILGVDKIVLPYPNVVYNYIQSPSALMHRFQSKHKVLVISLFNYFTSLRCPSRLIRLRNTAFYRTHKARKVCPNVEKDDQLPIATRKVQFVQV